MNLLLRLPCALSLLVLIGCAGLERGAPIGVVTRVEGLPEIGRDGARYLADEQSRVRLGDVLETNTHSRMRVILDDGTSIELGGDARLVLKRYQPRRGLMAPRTAVTWNTGSVDLRSGATSRGWRSRFEVATPLATLRMREARLLGEITERPRVVHVGMRGGRSISVRNEHGSKRLVDDRTRVTVPSNAGPTGPMSWRTEDMLRLETTVQTPRAETP